MILHKGMMRGVAAILGCLFIAASAFAVEVGVVAVGYDYLGKPIPGIPLVFKKSDYITASVGSGMTVKLKSTGGMLSNSKTVFDVSFNLSTTAGLFTGVVKDKYGFANSSAKRITKTGGTQTVEVQQKFNKLTVYKSEGVPADAGIVYLSHTINITGAGITSLDSSERVPFTTGGVCFVPMFTNTPTKPVALYVKIGTNFRRIPTNLMNAHGEFSYNIATDTLVRHLY